MADLAISFAISYFTARLTEPKAPRLQNLKGFSADYGAAIPLIFGPAARSSQNTVIWATDIKETVHKHKPAMDWLFGLSGALLPAQKTYTYSIDLAVLLCGNEISRVLKVWANKKVIFDAEASAALPGTTFTGVGGAIVGLLYDLTHKTHSEFSSMRVYTGTAAQEPDPTIEADKGVGNVPAYKKKSYCVFDDFQLAGYGNAVPGELEFLVEEAATGDLKRIVATLVVKAGIDVNTVSTSALAGNVLGFVVNGTGSVADSFKDLMTAFNFDAADIGGALRFVPRGRQAKTTVAASQIGGHADGDTRPEPIKWSRSPEVGLPREVTVTFPDPDRDYQPNTATARRFGGSSESNIAVNLNVTMTTDQGQNIANVTLWKAWSVRQSAKTTLDERRDDVGAGQIHAFETPTGIDTFLVQDRRRGANNVIELDLVADRPLIYADDLTGVGAPIDIPTVRTFGELNDPVFIEPPTSLTGGQPTLLIALSGKTDAGVFDPQWPGVNVWVSTDDSDFRQAGKTDTAAYMGVTTADLAAYGGANPDTVDTLSVDLSMSGGSLESVSSADAAAGLNLAYVGGEFVSIEDAAATGAYTYDTTNLWRGLFETDPGLVASGADFVVIDQALFRFAVPTEWIGQTLYFKFPQPNQPLADVPSWPYTPNGRGFGGGAGGVPTTPTGLAAIGDVDSVRLVWNANPATDGVTSYQVFRAAGLDAIFADAVQVAEVTALNWPDTGLDSIASDGDFTYFLKAVNVVGASSPTAGVNATIGEQLQIPSGELFEMPNGDHLTIPE